MKESGGSTKLVSTAGEREYSRDKELAGPYFEKDQRLRGKKEICVGPKKGEETTGGVKKD